MIRKILSKIETIVNNNWLNPLLTIYINFSCLPLRQAIRFPIFVYGRPKLFVANGNIILPNMCKTGMVKFNISRPGVDGNDSQSELRLCGNITFHGKAVIVQSNKLDVFGNLEIGQNMLMQEHCLIGCYSSIKVGNSFCMAHRSQMMDSNLHWMADMASRVVKRFSSPIIMGDYCWLCTNTLVLGGGMLPSHSTLSAYSMLNRNLKQEGEGCIFGGIPAKVIKRQVYRFGLNELDKYVCNFFRNNKEKEACPLPINITAADLTYKDYK